MDYVRRILPELVAAFGSDEARRLRSITGLLIGIQDHAPTAEDLGIVGDSIEDLQNTFAVSAKPKVTISSGMQKVPSG